MESLTYARARLWLGITSVGTLVVLASLALLVNFPTLVSSGGWTLRSSLWFAFGCVLLLLPFDLLGGYVLLWEYCRSRETFAAFVVRWFRATSIHTALCLAGLGLLFAGAVLGGALGSVFAAWLGTSLLLAFQPTVADWVGGVRKTPGDVGDAAVVLAEWGIHWTHPVWFVDTQDRSFVGGWVGRSGREELLLPLRWMDFPPERLAIQLARRLAVLQSGSRDRGRWLAQAWVVGSWAMALGVTGADPTSAQGLLQTWLTFQLFGFLGLITLPTPSRAGVLEADAYAAAQGVAPDQLLDLAADLDLEQEDEPARSPHVETIFHPIPSLATRRMQLADPRSPPRGAWQAARIALYLSWVGGGLLSRAVHCNLGRPELWVFLPGD